MKVIIEILGNDFVSRLIKKKRWSTKFSLDKVRGTPR